MFSQVEGLAWHCPTVDFIKSDGCRLMCSGFLLSLWLGVFHYATLHGLADSEP